MENIHFAIAKLRPGVQPLTDYYLVQNDNGDLEMVWLSSSHPAPDWANVVRESSTFDPKSGFRKAAETKVNTWRTRQENTEVTFELNGHTWDAGLKSQTRIEPLLKLEALPEGFFWTDHDNNDVPVTMDELRAIGAAMNLAIVQRGFAIHARQREMKQQLESMTAEELMAFVPGWPDEQA